MLRDEIKEYIRSKKENIDDTTLDYYANYFCVLSNNPQILGNNKLDNLIDNALLYASKIEFYDDNTEVLYFEKAKATFYSFTEEPKVVEF